MTATIAQTSFAGGEFAPALYGRVDLDKFHVGVALALNFCVDYRGGVFNRAGTQFCARVNTRVAGDKRLIPFIVAESRAYVLEFGAGYVRFFADGAQLTETGTAITGVTQANPGIVHDVAHGYSTGDEVFLASIGGMVQLNGKNFLVVVTDANHFSLTDLDGNAINTTTYGAYTAGGTASRIYQIASPYAAVDVSQLKYTQSADVLTLVHATSVFPSYDLKRVTASTFTLAPSALGPTTGEPTITSATKAGGGNFDYGYVVTSVSLDGKEESIASFPVVVQDAQLYNNADFGSTIKWTPPSNSVSTYRIYRWGPIFHNTVLPTVFGLVGETYGHSFFDSKSSPDFTKTPPNYRDPFSPGQIQYINVSTPGVGYAGSTYVPLIITDTGAGFGADGYAVVNQATNTVDGVVLTSPGKNYVNPTVVDGVGSATYDVTWDNSGIAPYPSSVSYFQQRRAFGGLGGFPERMVLSQIANYTNFDVSPLILDTDAITLSLASREVNAIRSMVPTSVGLVAFTSGGASLIGGGGVNTAITPANVINSPQASTGANQLPPLTINSQLLFAQAKGSVIRDLTFNYGIQSYYGFDRSALASHLFAGFTLVEWCWAEEPFKMVHAVRDDGTLLTLTYVPEQEVYGWAHHETQGLYRSVCSIPEGNENAVYQIVERYVQGSWREMVERTASRQWEYPQDAWFVDAGLALPAATPAATLYPAAATGSGIVFTADAAVFSAGDVGKVIWAGGGQATVVEYTDTTHVTADITSAILELLPFDPGSIPVPQPAGDWQLVAPVTVISGLDHLIGKTVTGLADGLVITPRVVSATGTITLDLPASKVIVGLAYSAQLQTLYLAADQFPQAEMKQIPVFTMRVLRTRGLKAGTTFKDLVEVKENTLPYSYPPSLISADMRTLINGNWNQGGQVCIQQDYPLPASIQAIFFEVAPGDTHRRVG